MRMGNRIARVEQALAARGRADQFHVVELVPAHRPEAAGRPPGLYRDGPEGSLAGILVFDPAEGEPVVPVGRLIESGLVIRCHLPGEGE